MEGGVERMEGSLVIEEELKLTGAPLEEKMIHTKQVTSYKIKYQQGSFWT